MKKYKIRANETIEDVTAKLYGSLDYQTKLANDNSLSYAQDLTGITVFYDETIAKKEDNSINSVVFASQVFAHVSRFRQTSLDLCLMYRQSLDDYVDFIQESGVNSAAFLMPVNTAISASKSRDINPLIVQKKGYEFVTGTASTGLGCYSEAYSDGYCSPDSETRLLDELRSDVFFFYGTEKIYSDVGAKYNGRNGDDTDTDILVLYNQEGTAPELYTANSGGRTNNYNNAIINKVGNYFNIKDLTTNRHIINNAQAGTSQTIFFKIKFNSLTTDSLKGGAIKFDLLGISFNFKFRTNGTMYCGPQDPTASFSIINRQELGSMSSFQNIAISCSQSREIKIYLNGVILISYTESVLYTPVSTMEFSDNSIIQDFDLNSVLSIKKVLSANEINTITSELNSL